MLHTHCIEHQGHNSRIIHYFQRHFTYISLPTHTSLLLHVLFTEELLRLDRTECFVHDGAFLEFSVSITKSLYKKRTKIIWSFLKINICWVISRSPTFLLLLRTIFLQLLYCCYCLRKRVEFIVENVFFCQKWAFPMRNLWKWFCSLWDVLMSHVTVYSASLHCYNSNV